MTYGSETAPVLEEDVIVTVPVRTSGISAFSNDRAGGIPDTAAAIPDANDRLSELAVEIAGPVDEEVNADEPGTLDEKRVATNGLFGWFKEVWQLRIEQSLARGVLHRWVAARKELQHDATQRLLDYGVDEPLPSQIDAMIKQIKSERKNIRLVAEAAAIKTAERNTDAIRAAWWFQFRR